MSLGIVTINSTQFAAPSEPTFVDDISFALDSSYPADGYPGLEAALNAAIKSAVYPLAGASTREIVDVLTAVDLSGYAVAWDKASKKLKIFGTGSAQYAALSEVSPGSDLHLVTLRLRILSK